MFCKNVFDVRLGDKVLITKAGQIIPQPKIVYNKVCSSLRKASSKPLDNV